MALRENVIGADSLVEAARLIDADAEQLKVNPALNIRGTAAVLDQYARDVAIDRSNGLDPWWPVVIRYAGLDDESSRYFAWEVFSILKEGFDLTNSMGETFAVLPQPIRLDLDAFAPPDVILLPNQEQGAQALSVDYGPAVWDPAPLCNYSTAISNKEGA